MFELSPSFPISLSPSNPGYKFQSRRGAFAAEPRPGAFFQTRRQQQVGWNIEACAQPLHHRHAQLLLAGKHFADAAWRAQDRHHVDAREGPRLLFHEMTDQLRRARRPARPYAFHIGGDQTRLRRKPGDVGRVVQIPEPVDEGTGARQLRATLSIENQVRIHHTVSASILSYSAWLPKNRIAKTPA